MERYESLFAQLKERLFPSSRWAILALNSR